MLRSLYIAGTGMIVQRQRMDVLTNNIANVETSGYKEDNLLSRSFSDVLIERTGDPNVLNISRSVGSQNYGTHIDEVLVDYTQGNLEETGRMSDLALQGAGFFVIDTQYGARYTRDGGFGVDSEGYLVNTDGDYVQGTNGSINVGTDGFAVDSQGNVSVDGVAIDKLRVVSFNDLDGLRKIGGNLYMNYTNQRVYDDDISTIKQGSLEMSNVDTTQQIVDMMEISRSYELNQKMVKMIDESLQKSVNEVGRV